MPNPKRKDPIIKIMPQASLDANLFFSGRPFLSKGGVILFAIPRDPDAYVLWLSFFCSLDFTPS